MEERSLHPSLRHSDAARTESRLRLLIDTGLSLAAESNLDVIAQTTLDAGLALCGASLGAFFYHPLQQRTGEYQLYKVAGADLAQGQHSASPKTTAAFALALREGSPARSEDITLDSRYTQNPPPAGALTEPAPVRSYLAVPVRNGENLALGTLVYGHPQAAVFSRESEELVTLLAAQTALAIEQARLKDSFRLEIAAADAARAEGRATSRRLLQALEAAQLGTWSWNADTGLIDFDERGAALFGVPPHTPMPRDELRTRLVHEDDLARSPADLQTVLASGGHYTSEYRLKTPDGADRWVSATGNATYGELTGEPTGITGTLQDITPRKNQEESLRTTEKLAATGRLAATIAHEINNPLEAVTNLIYLAKTDPITPPAVSRMLETADSELARVSQIAQQTLGFYRDTTRPVTVDLNELLQAVVDLFDRKLAGKRIHCTLDLQPGLSVVGLQGEIRQVVSNLLVNAIDASDSGGSHIRIRARQRRRDGHHGVSLIVSDQGTGIPQGVRHRLFTPFTTTKQSLGTGLGLWVTQGMVEKHGGSVRFRSRTASPSGSVFRVFLPKSGSSQLFAYQSSRVLQ